MTYLINMLEGVNFSPSSTVEEILQNVRTIISTVKMSVPLDRDFGVDYSFVDKPTAKARAMYSSEIIQAVKKYEPRANIVSISFSADIDGKLSPKVEVSINGEV